MNNQDAGDTIQPTSLQSDPSQSSSSAECASVENLSLDYVLGECSDAATRYVEQHCIECPRCDKMISSLQLSAGMLSFAASSAAPSSDAKSHLLDRIATEPQDTAVPDSLFVGSLDDLRSPTIPSSDDESAPATRQGESGSSNWWTRFSAPLLVVPVLLALGIVGYWGLNTHSDLEQAEAANGLLNTQVQLLNNRVDSLTGEMDGIDTVLSQDSSKKYAMTAMPSAKSRDAYGLLVINPNTQEAALLVWNLDPDRNAYEVLVGLPNGENEVISDLYVDASGNGMKQFDLDLSLTDLSSVHIRPKMVDTLTDSQLAETQPDVLYGAITAGLDQEADTMQRQP